MYGLPSLRDPMCMYMYNFMSESKDGTVGRWFNGKGNPPVGHNYGSPYEKGVRRRSSY